MMRTPDRSHYALPDGFVQISFSGGRTSAYMLHAILEANGGLPDRAHVSFQNTGREMPETLDFVQECGERWGVRIVWLEYQPEAPRFRVVDHASASRDGEPFEALIRKRKMLPNRVARFCTAEMKVHASTRYARSLGWGQWSKAVGIRADERHRAKMTPPKERWTAWCPLVAAGVSKRDVSAFWKRQPFDLRLANIKGKTPLGNCDGCFLKSEGTRAMLARDHPERSAWWERMETLFPSRGQAGTFHPDQHWRDLRSFVERQGDWIFDVEDALCQADGGECVG